ncbi:hypothetical protein TNIN_16621 [Trichonephila inaurata madagascariensis]|uniref:Uncharacterized protein n=1 Tax=Trichonephila inaurata madagascariensis TaxID=2747483 RepID=A0A8X6YTJ6_9ARAC|nr:hypothetical protein TNIN_16621 [Trichonephila inaurata madagascariensis]
MRGPTTINSSLPQSSSSPNYSAIKNKNSKRRRKVQQVLRPTKAAISWTCGVDDWATKTFCTSPKVESAPCRPLERVALGRFGRPPVVKKNKRDP